jgi:hypothetical protein
LSAAKNCGRSDSAGLAEERPFRIIESHAFLESVTENLGDLRVWDDLKYFFENFVARNPLRFEAIPGTDLRAVFVLADPPRTLYISVDLEHQTVTYEAIE